jgi:FkbM family methyltransferase
MGRAARAASSRAPKQPARPQPQPLPLPSSLPGAPASAVTPARLLLLLLALLACAALAPNATTHGLRGDGPAPPAGDATPQCKRTDWGTAASVMPEEWLKSSVYNDQTPLPFWLALPPREKSYVTQYMARSGMWAPVETQLFLLVLTSPKVRHAAGLVVDVGANLGYFSQLALSLGYEVFAFEPQARAQPYLAATAARNDDSARFHLHACAVGGVRGTVAMADTEMWELPAVQSVVPLVAPAVPDSSSSSSAASAGAASGAPPTVTVPMVLLADMLPQGVPIALLKVDTEGWERGVFTGVTPAMLALVRNVIVEAKTGEARLWLTRLLEDAGFHCAQYQEVYSEEGEGKWLDTKMSRNTLQSTVAVRLIRPCSGSDPEDFFFSKEDLPWQCDTVGC